MPGLSVLLDLVLPPTCQGCGREGGELCTTCARPLRRRLDEPARPPPGLPPAWLRLPPGIEQLEWLASYTGTTREVLQAFKYRGGRGLATPLGLLLAARWVRAGQHGDHVVAVPIHADRLRQRGYDQAVLLATVVGRTLGLPVVPALQRGQATSPQSSLGRQARAGNVGHAFLVTPPARAWLAGRWPIVVDDILTTGATLGACAAALRAAGAAGASALVVARER